MYEDVNRNHVLMLVSKDKKEMFYDVYVGKDNE